MSEGPRTLFLRPEHEEAGARFGAFAGWEVPRRYGDPAAEYRAAAEGAGVIDRSYRGRCRVGGRSPGEMLQGLLTNDIERPPEEAVYSCMLTPKGKIVTDLRVFRPGSDPAAELLLDISAAGVEGARAHFGKYVPPRFAEIEEVTGETGMLAVAGPDGPAVLAGALADALGDAPGDAPGGEAGTELPDAGALAALGEGGCLLVRRSGGAPAGEAGDGADADGGGGGRDDAPVLVAATGEVGVPALEVIAGREAIRSLWTTLVRGGAVPFGHAVWETLRIEAGRPRFGVDIDDSTMPQEAGLEERAISWSAGCYTGQEVVVRIRDRGHVNRRLRGLLLGDRPAPSAGTEIWAEGRDRPAGRITGAVESPLAGETVALGYVRREVEPPATVRLGAKDGDEVRVLPLDGGRGWTGVSRRPSSPTPRPRRSGGRGPGRSR